MKNKYVCSIDIAEDGSVNFSLDIKKSYYAIYLPEVCMQEDILKNILDSALGKMTESQRYVVLLLYYERLNVFEASLVLNLPVNTIYSHASDAVFIIQEIIDSYIQQGVLA